MSEQERLQKIVDDVAARFNIRDNIGAIAEYITRTYGEAVVNINETVHDRKRLLTFHLADRS